MYRTDFWTLWEKARVGCFERTALKHVYYLGWNRSPAQVGCMRQVLGPGALGRPRGIGWRGRWERGLGWGIHVDPWLIHVNVWLNPLQYCKVISLQLIKKKSACLWSQQISPFWRHRLHWNGIAKVMPYTRYSFSTRYRLYLTMSAINFYSVTVEIESLRGLATCSGHTAGKW